jgi:hypothetical protein
MKLYILKILHISFIIYDIKYFFLNESSQIIQGGQILDP